MSLKKTPTMQSLYESALAHAKADGLTLAGETGHDNVTEYIVCNPTSGSLNIVSQTQGVGVMRCTCEAAKRGHYCKHRAFMRLFLIEQIEQIQQAVESVVPAAVEKGWLEMSREERAQFLTEGYHVSEDAPCMGCGRSGCNGHCMA